MMLWTLSLKQQPKTMLSCWGTPELSHERTQFGRPLKRIPWLLILLVINLFYQLLLVNMKETQASTDLGYLSPLLLGMAGMRNAK